MFHYQKYMKKVLIASGAAILALTMIASAQGYTFNANLMVGSTGPDVVALQTWLMANGYSIPSLASGAASKGYFGSQTKAAVQKYQAAMGLPATGFVGPLTRGKLNAGGSAMNGTTSTTAVTCPAGYTCVANSGTTTTTTGTNGTTVSGPTGITTPGVPGIMSVTQGPISVATAYAGNTMVPVIDARVQAQYSDLAVQAMTIDLGTNTNIYNYVASKIYVIDPTTNKVLASQPLNSSTVVQNGSVYVVGIAGLNFVVPKGTFKDLQIAVDLYPTILTQFLGSQTFAIDATSIRAVDGAGVNLYGPLTSFSQNIVVNQTQTLTATANISLDPTSPLANAYGVTNVSAGTYLGLPVLTFDVNAQGDNLHLHNVSVSFNTTSSTGGGSINQAYLFQGSTNIMSSAITCANNYCTATFSNIPDNTPAAVIQNNQTQNFTVKVDVNGPANTNFAQNIIASTTAFTIYGSTDNTVSANGTALGNLQTVQGQGAVFALSGTPTITKTNITPGGASTTTFSYTATFNIVATSVGTTTSFGLPSIADAAFGSTTTGFDIAQVYVNGSPSTALNATAAFSQPTNTVLGNSGQSFSLSNNQSVTIPVTYSFTVTSPGANVYGVQLNGIKTFTTFGSGTTTSAFMKNQPAWRTSSI